MVMKRASFPFILMALCVVFGGCHNQQGGNSKHKFAQKQKDILELYNMADSIYYKEKRIDTTAFLRFIDKATEFAKDYPKDELSPDMLYRAGIGAMIIAKSAENQAQRATYCKKAIAIFDQFQEAYPNHKNYKYCYYQRGIIYDDILGDVNSAEDQYRDFVNRYPDDPLAPQLEEYIKMLGKSDKEIGEILQLQ